MYFSLLPNNELLHLRQHLLDGHDAILLLNALNESNMTEVVLFFNACLPDTKG